MNKPRNRKTNRVPMSLRVDTSTFEAIEAIRRLAHETGKSQSEVVDEAMVAMKALNELMPEWWAKYLKEQS